MSVRPGKDMTWQSGKQWAVWRAGKKCLVVTAMLELSPHAVCDTEEYEPHDKRTETSSLDGSYGLVSVGLWWGRGFSKSVLKIHYSTH